MKWSSGFVRWVIRVSCCEEGRKKETDCWSIGTAAVFRVSDGRGVGLGVVTCVAVVGDSRGLI